MISALGVWAAGAVTFGYASLPPFRTTMPFGESGFGDGLTCLSCAQSARAWRHEIEDGRPVVLFDTDVDRENRTAPGGLWADASWPPSAPAIRTASSTSMPC